MKTVTIFSCLLMGLGSMTEATPVSDSSNKEAAASRQISKWQKQYNEYVEQTVQTRQTGCTKKNIVYRQEWGTLSPRKRIEYIKAVECLRKKPAVYPTSEVPGSRSHFDDFAATHIIETPHVHFSGLFFHFHRYFTWLYEKALQDECGYNGTQPYWDWTLSWQDPRQSTVFDGSPTSMGSNGLSIPHGPTNISAFGLNLTIAPATGGGCLYKGPFANATVDLGPVAYQPLDADHGLAYNPRCLARDLSPVWANQTKPTDVAGVLATCGADLGCWDTNFEAISGVHAGGHFTIGSLNVDAYASAGDPVFYLHHAQVDRIWTLWQSLDLEKRTNAVYGTSTAFNDPPSANVTLETDIDFGVLAPKQPIKKLVSAIDGPFCYMYI